METQLSWKKTQFIGKNVKNLRNHVVGRRFHNESKPHETFHCAYFKLKRSKLCVHLKSKGREKTTWWIVVYVACFWGCFYWGHWPRRAFSSAVPFQRLNAVAGLFCGCFLPPARLESSRTKLLSQSLHCACPESHWPLLLEPGAFSRALQFFF